MRYLLFLFFLPLCLFADLQKISVQFEWIHQFQYAGFYTAIEKGYYKDAGLEVSLQEFSNGINVSEDVLNEKATFGISSSSIILERLKNKPVVLVASYFKQNALALVTSKDIKQLSDLKHKKIMLTQYQVDGTGLGVMLSQNGLTKENYQFVNHSFNINAFLSSQVDAVSVFLTNEIFYLNQSNTDYNIFIPSDYGIYSYDLELFTSSNVAHKDPEMVKNFTEATNKGWEYALDHQEEIIDLIYNKYTKKKSKEALLFEAKETERLFKRNSFTIGSVIPELVRLNAVIFQQLGLVKDNTNLETILNSYIFANWKKLSFTKEELAFIEQNKTIKIANEMDWEPFDYNQFGKPLGLSIDYIKLLFDKVGLKYEFINGYTWEELLALFENKKIDVMPAMYKTQKRLEFTNFTNPYYKNSLGIFTRKASLIRSLKNLQNKKIGIVSSDGSVQLVKKHLQNSTLIEYPSSAMLFDKLSSGEVDAVVENTLLVQNYIDKSTIKNVQLLELIQLNEKEREELSVHVGVRKDLTILHSILQKAIDSLDKNDLHFLKEKWINPKDQVSLNEVEKNYLKTKEIHMCIDPDWMPFEKFEDGKHIGMSADFFQVIEKKLDKNIKILPTASWKESVEAAKQRKCDLFSLAMQTPKRSKYMNFTTPYLSTPLVLATQLDVTFIADMDELENKTVGVSQGYAFLEILRKKYPKMIIVEVANARDGLNKVRKGEIFAYAGTLATIGYLFQKEFTGELKIAGKFQETWELGIAVRNDDPILYNIMEKAVLNIDAITKRDIQNRWIAINYEEGINKPLVFTILLVSLLIFLGILYWNRKLKMLNTQLKIAKQQAEENTKVKASFLANMSHEIRTPMNSILGMSYLLKETKLNEVQQSHLKKIQSSSNNLLTLLNDILDFSKLEAKKLRIEKVPFNLLELLNNVENTLLVKAYEKDLVLQTIYDKSLAMDRYGDSLRLSQVLINLISNAIKFTKDGKVQLIVENVHDSLFRFSVTDTGIGIKEEELNHIFDSFSQADSSITRQYGGTGLGLSISKELVELMGGTLQAKSTFNVGSTFSFEIHLEKSAPTKPSITSPIESKPVDITNKNLAHTKLKSISQEEVQELFHSLRQATLKRRPQLTQPILEKFEAYNLSEEDHKTLLTVKNMIQKYKFDEASEFLHAY